MLSNYAPGTDDDPHAPWNQDDPVMVSNCCGGEIYENTDICMVCLEHCEAVEEGDR